MYAGFPLFKAFYSKALVRIWVGKIVLAYTYVLPLAKEFLQLL